jgi:hypothetical protein
MPLRSLYIRSILSIHVFIVFLPCNIFLTRNASELQSAFSFQNNKQSSVGYTAIAQFNDGFIATGTDGRIDRISSSGAVVKSDKFAGEKFNCVTTFEKTILVAGDRGAIFLLDEKGIFRKQDSKTNEKINTLLIFRNSIIAGADQGVIITGDMKGSFKRTRLALRGNIVSLSARESECFGVTDEGEIIHTSNGIKWEITDFNKAYAGYYKTSYFTKILVTENRIAIAGKHNDDSPVLLLSTQGNVWTERTLVYSDDQGYNSILEDSPNDIIYNESEDMFYLACNRGRVFQLPSCNHCNKLVIVSEENLFGISSNDSILMIVGENFIIKSISLKW